MAGRGERGNDEFDLAPAPHHILSRSLNERHSKICFNAHVSLRSFICDCLVDMTSMCFGQTTNGDI